jgi:hypothetical protein
MSHLASGFRAGALVARGVSPKASAAAKSPQKERTIPSR